MALDPFDSDTSEERLAVLARLRAESPVFKLPTGQWLSLIHISEPTRPY